MNSFFEYLNSKGKILPPVVKAVADVVDCPKDRSYAPVQKGVGSAHPYSNGKTVKNSKEPGLADKGDKDLKYNPCKGHGKESKAAKLPTAEQYNAIQAVRMTIQSEPMFAEHLVREFKRNGLLSILIGEMLTHKETYGFLAEVMANETYGPEVCKKLVRAMNEDIAPPFTKLAPEVPVDDEEAPEGTEDVPEDDVVDDLDAEEVPEDDEELSDEEAPEDELAPGDVEVGPDGLPVAGAPIAAKAPPMPLKKPMVPMAPPAMENLLAAFNLLKS